MIFIGIDPGSKGGISIITTQNENIITQSHAYSDDMMKIICSDCRKHYLVGNVFACVEQVHSMPRDGVKGAFSFGRNFGYILGVLEANKIPYQLVPPQKWKNEFSLDNDKQKSIDCAKRLFPNVSLLPTERCRKEHDGMAESLLIAEWGRRHYGKN